MSNLRPLALLLVGALVGLFFADGSQVLAKSSNNAAQNSGTSQVENILPVVPQNRYPYWNSINVEDSVATLLLDVPKRRHFVLTDMWFLSKEGSNLKVSANDRVWLESQAGTMRHIVFDSPIEELSLPLRWQTGVVFQPGEQMWINYRSASKTDKLRRIHFTGYFEPTLVQESH